ncbi:MAG: PqqD family protein [Reichenbachiella sp.]|uniref:PqqD family protein n=1 Tax=Reichenbachiella sp. TaxID=2184521 RepID=UPI003262D6CC
MKLIENRPTVSSELFEDEAVIVNLENGNYYSYSGSGIDIWKFLKEGIDRPALNKIFTEKYNFESTAAEEFDKMVDELLTEGLLIEQEGAATKPANVTFRHEAFVTPALNKFTDMQDLLLLDPIHDVDATGWPMQKEEDAEENQSKKNED